MGFAHVDPAEADQRKQKAELLLDAAQMLGLDALGVGEGDLAFGPEFLVRGAEKRKLPYVCANLNGADGKLLFPARRILDKGGRRIGITAVLQGDPALQDVTVSDPTQALAAVVRELREGEKVDVVVVLSHLGLPADRELATKVPGIDLIFGGHSRSSQFTPVVVGDTAIYQAASRGKIVGQATVRWRPDARGFTDPGARGELERQREQVQSQLTRYESQRAGSSDAKEMERLDRTIQFSKKRMESITVPPEDDGKRHLLLSRQTEMAAEIPDDAAMRARIEKTLDALGPEARTAQAHLPPEKADPHRDTGDFVGAAACRSCHPAQYADWQGTAHARAWPSLVREKRHMDLDCWRCHVTGAGQPGGPKSPSEVGILRNVQCEACHGPGLPHSKDPKAVHLSKAPSEALCRVCHDSKQDGGRFDPKSYLPRVDHK